MRFVMKWRGTGGPVALAAALAAGVGGCGGRDRAEPVSEAPEPSPLTPGAGPSQPEQSAPPDNAPSPPAEATTSGAGTSPAVEPGPPGAALAGNYVLAGGPGEVETVHLRVNEDGTFELASPEKEHKAAGAWKLEGGLAVFDGRVEEEDRTVGMKLKPVKGGLELGSAVENGVSQPLAGNGQFIFKKQ